MRPRPRSRKNPVEPVDLERLAEEVAHAEFVWGPPQAIAVGSREWRAARADPDFLKHVTFWPGGEDCFHGVPVVQRMDLAGPRILQTTADMEEALLENRRGR